MIRYRIYPDRKIKGIVKIDASKGETIEAKVRRITDNKEPIADSAPPIYTPNIVTGKQIGRAHV